MSIRGVKEGGYTPYGGCKEFMECRDPEVIIAGPAETGKTLAALWLLHIQASKYPRASIVIARKRYSDVHSTVLQTLKNKVLPQDGSVIAYGGEAPRWYDYSNGSRIWVAGMDKSSKVLSSEHDIIYFNQAEEGTLTDWEIITTRTTGRAGNMPYAQAIGDANPAHPTHWILQRRDMGHLKLITNTHTDNPMLFDPVTGEITEQGKRTMGTLDRLTGARYMRLRKGLWAAPEGAIYDIFDAERHKVKSFEIPITWPRIVGVDPFGAIMAGVWLAWDPQNQVLHVYREYAEPFGLTVPQHAANVLKLSKGETVWRWIGGGPSERAWRLEWQAAGVPLEEPSVSEVWVGIDRVYQLLRDDRLMIHDCCTNLLNEIGAYRRKLDKDGRATENIADKEDYHMLDALRYAVVTLTQPQEVAQVVYDPVRIGGRR